MEESTKCPECGASVNEYVRFCKECGARLTEGIVTCTSCGKEISRSARFCTWCGEEFRTAAKLVTDNMRRPASVSAISWIIIILNALALFMILMAVSQWGGPLVLAFSGVSMTMIAMGVVEGIVFILLGLGLLNGIDTCRFAYLILNPISHVAFWATIGFQAMHILTVFLYIIALVVLTRPEAVSFFRK